MTRRIEAKEGAQPQRLGFNNLTNATQGITGLVFDIEGLPASSLDAGDFQFQVSPHGTFDEETNQPSGWQTAPQPSSITVLSGSPSRVVIEWPQSAIANQWLRTTILANQDTGLAQPEVYYVGHLLGETTGLGGSEYSVTFADLGVIRSAVGQPAGVGSNPDINKDASVSFADISSARLNIGAQLTNITIPSSGGSRSQLHGSHSGPSIFSNEADRKDKSAQKLARMQTGALNGSESHTALRNEELLDILSNSSTRSSIVALLDDRGANRYAMISKTPKATSTRTEEASHDDNEVVSLLSGRVNELCSESLADADSFFEELSLV